MGRWKIIQGINLYFITTTIVGWQDERSQAELGNEMIMNPFHVNADGSPRYWPGISMPHHQDLGIPFFSGEGIDQITIPIQVALNSLIRGAYDYVFGI
jgi:hypothetical protein